jgi:hypothetical protein
MRDVRGILQENWNNDTDDPDRIFSIPSYRMPELEKKVSALNRRMKSGMTGGLTIEIVSKETKKIKRDDKEYAVEYVNCKLIGTPPIIEGWELIAVVDHRSGNLVRVVPDKELPAEYRDVDPRNCDHCKVDRFRNETVILKNVEDGEYAQVGKSCLKDFLGHTNPRVYFNYAESMFDIKEMLEDAESGDPEIGGNGGSRGQWVIPLEEFLVYVATEARLNGYMSGTNARKYNDAVDQNRDRDEDGDLIGVAKHKSSTASLAIRDMFPSKEDEDDIPVPTEEDREFAQRALEFVKNRIEEKGEDLNDFEYNLKQLISMEEFPGRYAGYVAAIIGMYKREIEGIVRQEKRKPSEYVGSAGDKIEIVVTVAAIFGFETQYGYAKIVKMVNEEGDEFKWMTSSDPNVDQGDKVKIKATIKGHETYKGVKQTQLVRVKVVERLGNVEKDAERAIQGVSESIQRIRNVLHEVWEMM